MNIQELKLKTSEQLITQAEELGIERSWKTRWRAKSRATARIDVAASDFGSATEEEMQLMAIPNRLWSYGPFVLAAVMHDRNALEYASARAIHSIAPYKGQ